MFRPLILIPEKYQEEAANVYKLCEKMEAEVEKKAKEIRVLRKSIHNKNPVTGNEEVERLFTEENKLRYECYTNINELKGVLIFNIMDYISMPTRDRALGKYDISKDGKYLGLDFE